ncbi:thermonuclease family protein [Peribacillus loiseleuriae]|uniref:TNase-like domain-containing protein n=1 Tax=Peribacillus loiseleuriae TaxID=1679170 RepID=A0A0K9GQS5_9BACI|nr:thermonuclease family protein [Peribacillus loiseleuriae]KMY48627.1 hypothetical protein AC625_03105 [Peribacillus loiseleuriae]
MAGHTLKVNFNGKEETTRLLLVDTSETVHPSKPVQPFGKETSDYTKSLVLAGMERLFGVLRTTFKKMNLIHNVKIE